MEGSLLDQFLGNSDAGQAFLDLGDKARYGMTGPEKYQDLLNRGYTGGSSRMAQIRDPQLEREQSAELASRQFGPIGAGASALFGLLREGGQGLGQMVGGGGFFSNPDDPGAEEGGGFDTDTFLAGLKGARTGVNQWADNFNQNMGVGGGELSPDDLMAAISRAR